ncbi:hypothetical protein CR513_50922, partial [Mucuna pruriens]
MTPLLPLPMIMTLSNKFIRSIRIQSNLIEMSMVQQLEEMHRTIHKLNNELITKEAKEKSLEEKVVQLMHNHEKQSEKIRQQNEQTQLIIYHYS